MFHWKVDGELHILELHIFDSRGPLYWKATVLFPWRGLTSIQLSMYSLDLLFVIHRLTLTIHIAYVRVAICVRKNPYDDIPSLYTQRHLFSPAFTVQGHGHATLGLVFSELSESWGSSGFHSPRGDPQASNIWRYMEILEVFFSPFFVFVWRSLQL